METLHPDLVCYVHNGTVFGLVASSLARSLR
jgi:hypothetical protein